MESSRLFEHVTIFIGSSNTSQSWGTYVLIVVSIMIGDIAVLSFEDLERPFIRQTIPMFVLAILQITLAFASLKSVKLRYFMDGKPQIIINQGKIDEKAMCRQRYNFDDLLTQLRTRNY
jgi:uncharacterized membrane protein YcaP (DUF421 family)